MYSIQKDTVQYRDRHGKRSIRLPSTGLFEINLSAGADIVQGGTERERKPGKVVVEGYTVCLACRSSWRPVNQDGRNSLMRKRRNIQETLDVVGRRKGNLQGSEASSSIDLATNIVRKGHGN